jgi:hypothetical protein
MADVAKRLVGPIALANSSTVLYSVPLATTAIVRSIHVSNANASTGYTFSLAINGTASTVANQIFNGFFLAPAAVMDWSGFLVLNAGDTLQGVASAASSLSIVICGVEVS